MRPGRRDEEGGAWGRGRGCEEGGWIERAHRLDSCCSHTCTHACICRYVSQGHNDAKMAALVDDYHARFLSAIQKIWDEHAPHYCPKSQRGLVFVK